MTAPTDAEPADPGQPFLHDLVSCVDAPSIVLSDRDGQIRAGGVQGWFLGDRRLLHTLTVRVGGEEPTHLSDLVEGSAGARFTGVLRRLGDASTDPTVLLRRRRDVGHERLVETVTVSSTARDDVEVALEVCAGADFASTQTVRGGRATGPCRAQASAHGLTWSSGDTTLSLSAEPAPDSVDPQASVLRWHRRVATGARLEVVLVCTTSAAPESEFVGTEARPWRGPRVEAADPRLPAVVAQGDADLRGLLLADSRGGHDDVFVSAGSPWYLTLFGRDSLWAARMLLPLGTDLALGTLRTLARRQGHRDDAETEEQPGKILHEVRAEPTVLGSMSLPPLYYGTVDATPLFVTLLADAWRWGADEDAVRGLLPHAEDCLRWMERQADGGFIRYADATGHGLSNQGWKDSEDAISWSDGRLAEAPIALSEVQAYAHEAAVCGADLLDGFGLPGARHWREWAHGLAARFRDRFWVEDERGRYPAVALDRHGAPVDSVASNMGHLLGTGILDADEARLVAARLAGDDMDSGFGLRTLTRRSPRFSGLSYHCGSVWPHDTAVAVHGLCREGHRVEATRLLRGLVEASPAFDHRLPELYCGDTDQAPVPYPTACRPQAWAAAAPFWALVAVLGVRVDVPAGVVRVPAHVHTGLGPLAVSGLDAGGYRLDVAVDADGRVTATSHHPALEVHTVP